MRHSGQFLMEEHFECRICGKPAVHRNYKVRSCSGCKSFYQRASAKKARFTCYFGGNCSTLAFEIKSKPCKACRYRKYVNLVDEASFTGQPGKERKPERQIKSEESWTVTDGLINERHASDTILRERKQLSNGRLPWNVAHSLARDKWMNCRNMDEDVPYPLFALQNSVTEIFGDQIDRWGTFRKCPDTKTDQNFTPEIVANEVDLHNCDFIERMNLFAHMLVGFSDLSLRAKTGIWIYWKVLVYSMIHHAPFMTEKESYITYGEKHVHYSRYWQEKISFRPLMLFIYSFCTLLRDLDLEKDERYLLLAVVLLEPDDSVPAEPACRLGAIHRFYMNLLFRMIMLRCEGKSISEIQTISSKLSYFFSTLRLVQSMAEQYSPSPPDTMKRCFARVAALQQENR